VCATLQKLVTFTTAEVTLILIKNCTNLKILCSLHDLTYSNLVSENRKRRSSAFPCSLEYVGTDNYNRNVPFQDIYRDFPKLQILSVTCNSPQDIITSSTLTVFAICVNHDSQMPFIFPSCPSLQTLLIIFGPRY